MVDRTLLTAEHELFRASFRQFVDKEMVPHHLEWERAGIVDRDVFRAAGSHGFLGMAIPEQYGGGGVDDFRYNLVIAEETQRAGLCLPYFLRYCSDEQRERWLPGIASG